MMGRSAAQGAMGIHFFRPDLLGITAPPSPRVNGTGTHTDFRATGILIYEPQANGSLELVAVENLVFAAAWARSARRPPDIPRRPLRLDGGRPDDRDRRGAHVRAALRSARLDLPRESERRVHTLQPACLVCSSSRCGDRSLDAWLALKPASFSILHRLQVVRGRCDMEQATADNIRSTVRQAYGRWPLGSRLVGAAAARVAAGRPPPTPTRLRWATRHRILRASRRGPTSASGAATRRPLRRSNPASACSISVWRRLRCVPRRPTGWTSGRCDRRRHDTRDGPSSARERSEGRHRTCGLSAGRDRTAARREQFRRRDHVELRHQPVARQGHRLSRGIPGAGARRPSGDLGRRRDSQICRPNSRQIPQPIPDASVALHRSPGWNS